jgi:preprotein translocase subunit SecY
MNKLALIWKTKDLRNKILIVMGLLLLTRVLAHVPIPGIDPTGLRNFFQTNQFLNLIDIFSGGGLTNLSIAMLGVGPYITASILVQVSSMVFPQVKKMMHEEGEIGKKKITQYTRMMTVPFAFLQGFALMKILSSQGILTANTPYDIFLNLAVASVIGVGMKP